MKATEAAALLTIAAAYDNRKPDADQARAWAMVLDGLNFDDCRTAIVNHYRTSREWMMPSDIVSGVSAIRVERWNVYYRAHGHLTPPPELADDAAAENRWICDVHEGIRAGEITHPDQVNTRGALQPHDVTQLGLLGQRIPRDAHPVSVPDTRHEHQEHTP